ncbi:MAG: NrtA/SsuA/CpmA family ABC transporter substrate-binding protein [Burkholderiales bacterium]|nr:NrtA/SsuA/CpmA family ABC transporter substrate-binding protein [Burkholderiales bacterium]
MSMFKALASLVLAGMVGASGSAHAQVGTTIRVGVQSIPPDAVFMAKDWLGPHGLKAEVSEFSSGGDMMQAFIAGRIDIADGGSGRLVTLAATQPDSFYIVAVRQSGGDRYGVMVPSGSGAKTIQELRGKKVGTVGGSGSNSTFRLYLQQNGMAEADFQMINMKVQDMQSALSQGLLDAAVAWEPQVALAETAGVAKRIISLKGVNESPNFYLVSRKFADANPSAVSRFLAAAWEESELIRKDAPEAGRLAAAQIAKKGVQVDPKAMALALTRINVNPEIKDEMLAELTPVAESMLAAKRIKQMPDFKALVNRKFYESSIAQRGK